MHSLRFYYVKFILRKNPSESSLDEKRLTKIEGSSASGGRRGRKEGGGGQRHHRPTGEETSRNLVLLHSPPPPPLHPTTTFLPSFLPPMDIIIIHDKLFTHVVFTTSESTSTFGTRGEKWNGPTERPTNQPPVFFLSPPLSQLELPPDHVGLIDSS